MTKFITWMAYLFYDHLDDGFPWPQILFCGAVVLILLSRFYPDWGREDVRT